MNWVKSKTETDDFIQHTIYNDMPSEADGIDLRIEMNRILYGGPGQTQLGHWVVLRLFNREIKSKYYNDISREGINGPPDVYTDILVRSRRMPYPRSNTSDQTKAGEVFQDSFMYWFEYTVPIKLGDQIYELDTVNHKYMPTTYNFVEKFDIKRIHPYRMENGNIQYFAALGEYNNITY